MEFLIGYQVYWKYSSSWKLSGRLMSLWKIVHFEESYTQYKCVELKKFFMTVRFTMYIDINRDSMFKFRVIENRHKECIYIFNWEFIIEIHVNRFMDFMLKAFQYCGKFIVLVANTIILTMILKFQQGLYLV